VEWRSPGGAPRRGIHHIETTRGDRLLISLLSAAYIHLDGCADRHSALGRDADIAVVAVLVFRYV